MASVRPRRAPPNRSNGLAMSCHGSAEAATPPHQPAATRARRRDEAAPETNKQTNRSPPLQAQQPQEQRHRRSRRRDHRRSIEETTTRESTPAALSVATGGAPVPQPDKGERSCCLSSGLFLPRLCRLRTSLLAARLLPAAGSHGRDWRASCLPVSASMRLSLASSSHHYIACLPDDTQDKTRAIAGRSIDV
jgi:hypothetical protein